MITEMLVILAAVGMADESPHQQVVCAETGFSRAAEARDRDDFLSFVDPGARFLYQEVVAGREAIGAAWSFAFAADGPVMRWRPATVAVSPDGQLAISRGPYRSTSTTSDGRVVERWGHFISTWRLGEDGRWRVLFDTGGDDGMTPSEADIAVLESEPDCP